MLAKTKEQARAQAAAKAQANEKEQRKIRHQSKGLFPQCVGRTEKRSLAQQKTGPHLYRCCIGNDRYHDGDPLGV